ncbi:hypothetical protein AV530_004219 [Patagioenas fasciata monilis]|uniref:Uncharacterized protein n=1 Tax=Patagioenas fasciata monilis TaxID=372326 RepID=A0A1V4KA66_PATFA|nr:hypothetical protein AV530_004219 [Patagioenas fasciata monilis]
MTSSRRAGNDFTPLGETQQKTPSLLLRASESATPLQATFPIKGKETLLTLFCSSRRGLLLNVSRLLCGVWSGVELPGGHA